MTSLLGSGNFLIHDSAEISALAFANKNIKETSPRILIRDILEEFFAVVSNKISQKLIRRKMKGDHLAMNQAVSKRERFS